MSAKLKKNPDLLVHGSTYLSPTSRRFRKILSLALVVLTLLLLFTLFNHQPPPPPPPTVEDASNYHEKVSLTQYLDSLDISRTAINVIIDTTVQAYPNALQPTVKSILDRESPRISTNKDLRVHGSGVGTVQQFGNPTFGYMNLDRGNISPNPVSPAPPTSTTQVLHKKQKRKRGLLAMPVSGRVKDRVASLIDKFKSEDMDVMLFHYDDVEWADVPQYAHVTSIRVKGQTKFWYAKRFVVPELMDNYDYLFLWDDDIILDDDWSPLQFVAILQHFAIHVAQPALHSGSHYNSLQHETVRLHPDNIEAGSPGRFSEFVEIMFPIFSREAWQNCIWETIPYDGFSYWGIDNVWYPHCASLGYCRFAIIDVMSVGHLDSRSLRQRPDKNLRELGQYLDLYRNGLCIGRPSEMDWVSYFRSLYICHYLKHFVPGRSFRWIIPIDPNAHGGPDNTSKCVEPHLWPGIENAPWYGDTYSDPVPVSF